MQTTSDMLDRAAADVRRLVTRRVRELVSYIESEELREAIVLSQYLTPDNVPGAIRAHLILLRLLREDLADIGMTDPEWLTLVNALTVFLCQRHEFRGGRWVPKDADEAPAAKRESRLGLVG